MKKVTFTEILKKKELVDGFAEFTGKKKNDSEETLDTVFAYLEDILYTKKKGFRLGGIGTHKVAIVPEREHPIPKTDKKTLKPEHYAIKFKVNDGLKEDLANIKEHPVQK